MKKKSKQVISVLFLALIAFVLFQPQMRADSSDSTNTCDSSHSNNKPSYCCDANKWNKDHKNFLWELNDYNTNLSTKVNMTEEECEEMAEDFKENQKVKSFIDKWKECFIEIGEDSYIYPFFREGSPCVIYEKNL